MHKHGMVTGDDGWREEGVVSTPRYSFLGKLIWSRQSQSLPCGPGCFTIAISSLGETVGQVEWGVLVAVPQGTNFNGVGIQSLSVHAGHW